MGLVSPPQEPQWSEGGVQEHTPHTRQPRLTEAPLFWAHHARQPPAHINGAKRSACRQRSEWGVADGAARHCTPSPSESPSSPLTRPLQAPGPPCPPGHAPSHVQASRGTEPSTRLPSPLSCPSCPLRTRTSRTARTFWKPPSPLTTCTQSREPPAPPLCLAAQLRKTTRAVASMP